MDNNLKIEICARAAHEANRSYCLSIGDKTQPSWDEAPDWQRESCRRGVAGALSGNSPEQSHESWRADKSRDGWTFGFIKDPAKKQHPCMAPYAALPVEQRLKGHIFVGVVQAVGRALGLPVPFTLTFHIEQKFAAGVNPDQVLTAIHQDLEKLLKRPVGLKDGETEKTK